MRKFLSVNYSQAAFNIAMLALRVGAGAMAMSHGYSKLVHFADMKSKFMDFLGIGSTLSLILVIFSEFFCSIFLIIGLFSRLVVIPLIISMSVVLFKAHNGELFGNGERPALYLTIFITLLLCGPGKASIDGTMR
jgi:putative oxidoreductase